RIAPIWSPQPRRGGLSRGPDLQSGEGPFVAVDPQSDAPLRRGAEAIDDEARLLRVVDEHAHRRGRHLDARVEPLRRIGDGIDRGLVFPRRARAELLPGVLGPRDVLNGVRALDRVVGAEAKWAEVDRFEGLLVRRVERDSDEARALLAEAAEIDVDGPLGEI